MEVADSEFHLNEQKPPKPKPRRKLIQKIKIEKESENDGNTYKLIKIPKKPKEPKTWVCKKCSIVCETRKALTEHNNEMHMTTIRCSKRGNKEEKPSFTFDKNQEIYCCGSCTQEFQTEEDVQFHIVKFHEEHFICDVCNHVSKKAYLFAIHMKEHGNDDMFYCPLCSYSSLRRTCLNSHINIVHYHKFSYNCATCGKGFNDPLLFKEHDNEHLGIKPFVCIVCNKEFVYSRYMTQHQIRHHTVYIQGTLHKTQCGICLKVFSNSDNLLKHITTKHKYGKDKVERPNLCDLCGKGFRTPIKLKLHYRIHTGEKPYACKFCGKCFSKKDYLVMHERVHTGEKPYACEYCGKGFNQVAPLRIHVRGHTGERPYICQFCHNGYISRGSLNLHMKTCSGIRSFNQ